MKELEKKFCVFSYVKKYLAKICSPSMSLYSNENKVFSEDVEPQRLSSRADSNKL